MDQRLLLVAPLPVLLFTALLAWVLSRRVTTRRLGIGAAAASALSLAGVAWASSAVRLPVDIGGRPWVTAFTILPDPVAQATLSLRPDALSLLFAMVILAGSTLGILYLAQSLGAALIGYGRLWSAILLMVAGTLLGVLASDLLLLVFGWGMALVGVALARRVVGGIEGQAPTALSFGALSGLVLVIAVLGFILRPNDPTSGSFAFADLDARISLGTWLPLLIAVAIATGLPPFGRMLSDDEGTPPALHGVLIACGLPALAIYSLLRVLGLTLGGWPQAWFIGLMVLGALGVIGGAAHALRVVRFGPLVGWQSVVQWSSVLFSLGQYQPGRSFDDPYNTTVVLATLALAICTIWSTLLSALALGHLERRSGSDTIDAQPALRAPLRVAGLAYALAAGTAIGLPGLPGFWPRRWLLEQAATSPLLLALWALAGGLLALSYLGPLALFWRTGEDRLGQDEDQGSQANAPVLALAMIPLLVLGSAPGLMGRLFAPALNTIQPTLNRASLLGGLGIGLAAQIGLGAGALLVLGLTLLRRPARQRAAWTGGEAPDQSTGTPHAPQASGYSLRAAAAIADLRPLFGSLSRGVEWLSARAAWALQIFSGRYYLTGILIAALTLILLLMQ